MGPPSSLALSLLSKNPPYPGTPFPRRTPPSSQTKRKLSARSPGGGYGYADEEELESEEDPEAYRSSKKRRTQTGVAAARSPPRRKPSPKIAPVEKVDDRKIAKVKKASPPRVTPAAEEAKKPIHISDSSSVSEISMNEPESSDEAQPVTSFSMNLPSHATSGTFVFLIISSLSCLSAYRVADSGASSATGFVFGQSTGEAHILLHVSHL